MRIMFALNSDCDLSFKNIRYQLLFLAVQIRIIKYVSVKLEKQVYAKLKKHF